MRFKEIINDMNIESTLDFLEKYYYTGDDAKFFADYKNGYINVINELKILEPIINDMVINVKLIPEKTWNDPDTNEIYIDDAYYDVSGFISTSEYSQGLEFTKWEEWLGMEINNINNIPNHEFIAHCLYELTFIGFDQNNIQEEINEINKLVELCQQEELL